MPSDCLYGFHVCIQGSKKRQIRMTEDMRSRAVKVNGVADAFHCAVIAALCDRCVSITDNIAVCLLCLKIRQQVLRDGNIAEASF